MDVNPKPLIYPPYPHISPLVTISLFSISVSLFQLHNKSISSFVSFFKNQIPHVGDMVFAFVWLISLSMMICRSIHVAANGIIPFFLWLSNVLSRLSCLTLCNPVDSSPPGSSVRGDSPGTNTGVGCHALLQGIQCIYIYGPHLPYPFIC